jgi:hypothetical protein
MDLRARTLPLALAALLLPAAAADAKKPHSPVVKKVAPKQVFVGETLTVHGRYFRRGVNKNTVAFKRRGAKAVFVKAEKGTAKMLRVTLPKRLERALVVQNGTPVPTRLQIRVLAARFGKRFTRLSRSPIVGPEKPPAPPRPPEADPSADCDGDGQINRIDTDDDNDLLTDELEKQLKLDPCKADSDGDSVEDGYEYASARDLNEEEHGGGVVFYPEKLPYPNALDGTDGGTDHDGDTLTLKEEYDLWKFTQAHGSPRTLAGLTYSAGMQHSLYRFRGDGTREPSQPAASYDKQAEFLAWGAATGYATARLAPVDGNWSDPRAAYDIRDFDRSGGPAEGATFLPGYPAETTYFDHDADGWLDDAERDEDADGMTNFQETRGCGKRVFWDDVYNKETPYYLGAYADLRHDDPDTDGDGVRDGADDQDHDDVPNLMECSRALAAELGKDPRPSDGDPPLGRPLRAFVNVFNPCLPHPRARTCRQYVDLDRAWAPFNADEKYYFIWN